MFYNILQFIIYTSDFTGVHVLFLFFYDQQLLVSPQNYYYNKYCDMIINMMM